MKKVFSLFLIIVAFLLISPTHAIAETTYDMNSSANWNVRIDGASADDNFSNGASVVSGDLTQDGKDDIVVGAPYTDYNSRSDSGSVYIIENSQLSSFTDSGNTLDMATSTNYFLRIDGSAAGENLATDNSIIADLNNNGKNDLLISTQNADKNSTSASGSIYIIYDDILDNYSGTGNTLDLSDTSKFNLRIDGAASNDRLAVKSVADINQDDIPDLIINADGADNNSRNRSGSVYLLYSTLIDDYQGTGNTLRMNSSASYNVRIDGATASQSLGYIVSVDAVDLNYNDINDLVIGAYGSSYNSRGSSGSVYVLFDSLLSGFAGTGNTVDLNDSSKWNIRFDGAAAGDIFGQTFNVADLDSNNKTDLLITGRSADNNSRSGSGSIYIIMDSLLDNYTSTGNTVDMSDTTKFNVRIDGAAAGDSISDISINAHNFEYLGYPDLYLGTLFSDYNSRSDSGSVYSIHGSILSQYLSSTGNLIDLSDTSTYSLRYDGPGPSENFGYSRLDSADLNNDGREEILLATPYSSSNSRTASGSIWIIYNFPHTITTTSGDLGGSSATVKGTISASSSITTISGVQYQVGSNTVTSGWSSSGCTADDGSFNETSESYTCIISSVPTTQGNHIIYVRAYDSNAVYTAQSGYASWTYNIGGGSDTSSNSGPQISQASVFDQGGIFSAVGDSSTGSQSIFTILEPQTFSFDAFVSAVETTPTETGALPNPITNIENSIRPKNVKVAGNIIGIVVKGKLFWQVGKIQNIWYKAYGPGLSTESAAKIIPELQSKRSIISLNFSDNDLVPPGQPKARFKATSLKLAYSPDGISWKILPTSVVDVTSHTVAALDKLGGYYMIVGK